MKPKVARKLLNLEKYSYAGKKLEGNFVNALSLRAWPYRIIYCIDLESKYLPSSQSNTARVYINARGLFLSLNWNQWYVDELYIITFGSDNVFIIIACKHEWATPGQMGDQAQN